MPAKFVVKKGATGKFRFNLLSTNGQVVATSQTYESKSSALKGVESVRRFAASATLVDETVAVAKAPAKKAAAKKAAVKKKAPAKKAPAKKKAAAKRK